MLSITVNTLLTVPRQTGIWGNAMIWSQRRSAQAIIGTPEGRVDEGTWEAFLASLTSAIGDAALAKVPLVLDLAGIDYMSSRGLRVLTLARRDSEAKGVELTLARPNERMREILAISRYDKIFTVANEIAE